MNKIIKTLFLMVFVCFMFISCDIDSSRPLTKDVTVVLTDIPSSVKAVAIYCNLNEWKCDNVNGNPTYIADVTAGKAEWKFEGYTLATPLKFQFTPLPSADTKMGDDWWSFALSGSSSYSDQENNMYCNFINLGITNNVKITVSKASFTATGGAWSPFPIYGIDSTRQFNPNFKKCFIVE